MNDDLIICRCQEITAAEIEATIREHDLRTMPEVKRATQAGMGLCQGKTCGRLVTGILACETHQALFEILPDTSRPPVYPVPLVYLVSWIDDDD